MRQIEVKPGKFLPATAEQEAIGEAVAYTTANLSIVARAGAAKTSTLKMIAHELPNKSILCLAFNKAIADEMAQTLPKNCEARTLNSLGHRAVGRYLGRWPKLRFQKNYEIVKDLDPPRKSFKSIIDGLRLSKQLGYTPAGQAKSLLTFDELIEALPFEVSSSEAAYIKKACMMANKQLFSSPAQIDFDEQILCSATFPVSFPHYDVILVDEAQDLSALNHAILKKLARRSRLIVVGDPLQAIYAFRGAHEHSMAELAETFSTVEYQLTTSFRCARAIVAEANSLAPDMRPAEWAPEGLVETLPEWNLSTVKEADAVLCRLNAPLFMLNIALFAKGINSEFVGHDVVKKLQKILGSFGPKTQSADEVRRRIEGWEDEQCRKVKNTRMVRDEADCMRILCETGKDLAAILAHTRRLLQSEGRIKLMTIHKSKGLEFNSVFILDPEEIGDEGQENNIRYVAQTRAEQRLTYISMKDFAE